MKTNQSKRNINQGLITHVTNEIYSIYTQIGIGAETDGKLGIPEASGDSIYFFERFHLLYVTLILYVHQILQPDTIKHGVLSSNANVKKQEQQQVNDLSTFNGQAARLKSSLKTKRTGINLWKLPLISGAMILLALFEGLGTEPLWEDFGFGLLLAIICALGFGTIMLILAHATSTCMKEYGTTPRKQKIIALSFVIPVSIGFYFIAQQRVEHLAAVNCAACEHIIINPWLLFLFSILAFISSVILAYVFLPDKTEQEQINAYKQIKNELNQTENAINQIKQNGNRITENHTDFTIQAVSDIELGKSLENLIMTSGEGGYKHYININKRNRPFRDHVDCFLDKYPFTWKTYFQYSQNNGGSYEKSIE